MQTIDSAHYPILRIIYGIVKEDLQPLKYQLHPRELILRSMQDWTSIQAALTALENEGAIITTKQSDTIQISLTGKGLEICRAAAGK